MRLGALAALAALGLTAGCGGGTSAPAGQASDAAQSVKDNVDPVAQAAGNSANASSAAVTIDGKVGAQGQTIPLAGNGNFDFKGRKGDLALTVSAPGQDPLAIDEVVDGTVVCMKSKAFTRALPDGKEWLKIDLATAAKKSGVNISSLQQLGAGNDPTQFLKYLEKSGAKPVKLGRDDVDGTPATKYRATIDLTRLASQSDDATVKRSVRRLQQVTGSTTIPAEVWIDDQKRVRREHISYRIVKPQAISFDFTIEFSDYGKPVSVDVPAAGETVDALKLRGG